MSTISKVRAVELLAKFEDKQILVVGDVMLDAYVRGPARRMSPEAPVPVLRKKSSDYALGGAGNVARNVASLGARVVLLSVVGDDAEGELLDTEAKRLGISTCLHRARGHKTTQKIRYLDGAHHLLRVDIEESLAAENAEDMCKRYLRKAIENAHGVLVSDYAKGVIRPTTAELILNAARDACTPVLADVKPGQMKLFTGVNAISPNLDEAKLCIDQSEVSDDLGEVARKVQARFKTKYTFVTAADQGIYVRFGNEGVLVPQQHKVEVADTSGCGDTAAVVLQLAMLCGATPSEAAALANAAGAWVATKIGAAAPTGTELVEML